MSAWFLDRLPAFRGALFEAGVATIIAAIIGFMLYGDPTKVGVAFVFGWVISDVYRRT